MGKYTPKGIPTTLQRLTMHQMETARNRRRDGASFENIAKEMGVSIDTVHRYTKDINPKPSDGETTSKALPAPAAPSGANGGEKPVLAASKPSIIQIPVELDPEMMLFLAGTASVQGFTSLKEYINHHALPWLKAFRESADLLGADTPKDFVQRLKIVVDGYWEYQRIVEKAQEKVEKPVVKGDGRELPAK